jgi:hypothetical protein
MQQTLQLLDYLATQEDAVLTYHASNMVLAVHSNASYLSEPKARSRAGGHFFLSSDTTVPPNNGAVLNIAHIIKNVMSSATEGELAGLYIMACKAVYIRIILEELGHKQPPTPLQTDNAMADAVINGKIQPKRTKAMDMRFHWLRDREFQRTTIQDILETRQNELHRLLDKTSSRITSQEHMKRIPHANHCYRNATNRTTTTTKGSTRSMKIR